MGSGFTSPGKIVLADNRSFMRPFVTISISLRKVHRLNILIIFNYILAVLHIQVQIIILFHYIVKGIIMSIYKSTIILSTTLCMF